MGTLATAGQAGEFFCLFSLSLAFMILQLPAVCYYPRVIFFSSNIQSMS
jgi:hypothetical protein